MQVFEVNTLANQTLQPTPSRRAEAFRQASKEASKMEVKRSLKKGRSHKQQLPKTLLIPSGLPANNLTIEAERQELAQEVAVARVPECQLLPFIREARQGFEDQFGRGRAQ